MFPGWNGYSTQSTKLGHIVNTNAGGACSAPPIRMETFFWWCYGVMATTATHPCLVGQGLGILPLPSLKGPPLTTFLHLFLVIHPISSWYCCQIHISLCLPSLSSHSFNARTGASSSSNCDQGKGRNDATLLKWWPTTSGEFVYPLNVHFG